MQKTHFLLYGANGYTGRLITEMAAQHNLHPILAGRNRQSVEALAAEHHLPCRIISLDDAEALKAALEDVTVVLHAAGPFKYTAWPMLEACLQTGTHYIDITGEIEVFEIAKQYDAAAQEAGIMILPGAGFDVVPTDCLALYLHHQLPDATELQLAFASTSGGVSHGTALTMLEGLGEGGAVRERGRIVKKPLGHKGMWVDFGIKRLFVMSIPWGDVSTAHFNTGIPNIITYTGIKPKIYKALKFQGLFNWLLRTNFIRNRLKQQVNKRAPGPDAAQRQEGKSLVWGQVANNRGESAEARLTGPNGYTITAHTSLLIVQKVLTGDFTTGYQTPGSAYGADLILEVPGMERATKRIIKKEQT